MDKVENLECCNFDEIHTGRVIHFSLNQNEEYETHQRRTPVTYPKNNVHLTRDTRYKRGQTWDDQSWDSTNTWKPKYSRRDMQSLRILLRRPVR
eukprot:1840090-Amphidinium_carterae.1